MGQVANTAQDIHFTCHGGTPNSLCVANEMGAAVMQYEGRAFVSRPEEYGGGAELMLGTESFSGRGSKVWAKYLASAVIPATRIDVRGSTPQEFLDSLSNQVQLESLEVKYGSYSELTPLAGLSNLTSLRLRGATKVLDIGPLASLPHIEDLLIDRAFLVRDLSPLGALTTLRGLTYGNDYPGSDKSVEIESFGWARTLKRLEVLRFPGTRILETDFSVLLKLPNLRDLSLPLRRSYRKQVFSLAERSEAFASLAKAYVSYEAMR